MAHSPGVGYSSVRPPAPKATPAAAPAAVTPAPATAAASAPASAAAANGNGGAGFSLPSIPSPSLPGGTALEKAAVVLGILIVGMGLWSKLTGKSFSLGLTGFAAPPVEGLPAAKVGIPQTRDGLSMSMAQRTYQANPAKLLT